MTAGERGHPTAAKCGFSNRRTIQPKPLSSTTRHLLRRTTTPSPALKLWYVEPPSLAVVKMLLCGSAQTGSGSVTVPVPPSPRQTHRPDPLTFPKGMWRPENRCLELVKYACQPWSSNTFAVSIFNQRTAPEHLSTLASMEAPIPLQAPVPRSHLFRSHSSYSNDMYSVRTASRDMLSQPPRPYLGQHGSDNFDSKAPSSDRTHIDLARQQAGLCRPILHPVHSMAQQAASRSYEPPRQESRVSVNNLLDSASPSLRSRHITTTRDSPPSHSSSAPISPRNTHSTPSDGRLPGVSQVSLQLSRWIPLLLIYHFL